MTARAFILFLILYFSPAFCRAVPAVAGQESFPFLAESTADQVNVRAGQNTNFERVAQLYKGQEIVVIAKEFSWYKIQLPPTAESYIRKDYLQRLGQNAGGVVGDSVNVRAAPGINHTVLGQLTKGDQIYILDELEDWYRIEPVSESYGWVAEQFLAFKSNDVSAYRALMPSRPAVSEREPEKEQEEKVEPAVQINDSEDLESFSGGVRSFVGYVEAYKLSVADGISYTIVEEGRPVCYIQGANQMLGRFINQRVMVEGAVNHLLRSKFSYPVISVIKIRLML